MHNTLEEPQDRRNLSTVLTENIIFLLEKFTLLIILMWCGNIPISPADSAIAIVVVTSKLHLGNNPGRPLTRASVSSGLPSLGESSRTTQQYGSTSQHVMLFPTAKIKCYGNHSWSCQCVKTPITTTLARKKHELGQVAAVNNIQLWNQRICRFLVWKITAILDAISYLYADKNKKESKHSCKCHISIHGSIFDYMV